ncbi:Uncharacterised protein [Mesomycoplasma conjunctivae]|nr:Uncharacterised protein [Mesomycoplasma conjunctivae]
MSNQLFTIKFPFKEFLSNNILIQKPVNENSWETIYYTIISDVFAGTGVRLTWKFGDYSCIISFITYYTTSKKINSKNHVFNLH